MPSPIMDGIGKRNKPHKRGYKMNKQQLENKYLGKVVYHGYGQIGFGVVTGIDDRDPQKLRLRVKFTRSNTPAHLSRYDDRAGRVRCLLPRSVSISLVRYADINASNKIMK